jgi:hypothetical protein
MRALVPAQVDPLLRARDPRDQRFLQLPVVANEREDGAVVIGIRVDVEQLCVLRERRRERVDRGPVASLREVRHRLERELHGRTLAA